MAISAVVILVATLCISDPVKHTRSCEEDIVIATNQFQAEGESRFTELGCQMLSLGLIAKYINDHPEKYAGKEVDIVKWGCPREKKFDI
jgi:hypothetical protein